MCKRVFKNNPLSFDSQCWDAVSANLKARSISKKKLIIPVKALPFRIRSYTTVYFRCSLEKGPGVSSVHWKARLFPLEAAAICALVLMNLAGWISLFLQEGKPLFSSCMIWLAVSAFVLLVLLYYACLYRYCKKVFLRSINEAIEKSPSADRVN